MLNRMPSGRSLRGSLLSFNTGFEAQGALGARVFRLGIVEAA
jgi:hypothetical protein